MAKVKIEEAEDLNLTPIMNVVLVLIPLMLLNVVFMTITVIEVTMPQRSAGSATNGEPPKRLQVFISQQGFTVVEGQAALPAKGDCPQGGPTICPLKNEINPEVEIETDRHNWLELYNTLMEIKTQHADYKDHDQIEIVADSAVNFGVLVKAMDVSRYQRVSKADLDKNPNVGTKFRTVEEFNDSVTPLVDTTDEEGNAAKTALGLFPVVVLGMPTMSN